MIALANGELVRMCGVTENIGGAWRNGRWPEPKLRYCIRDQHPRVSRAIWEGEIAWALQQWANVFDLEFERIDDPRPGKAHFLFAVSHLGGPGGVLAQAGLVPYGLRRNDDFQSVLEFDSLDNFSDQDRSTVAMQFDLGETCCHEVGHSLGLSHDESNEVALLDPMYNPRISGLQPRDIVNAVALGYPKRQQPAPIPPGLPGPTPGKRPMSTALSPGQTYTAKGYGYAIDYVA